MQTNKFTGRVIPTSKLRGQRGFTLPELLVAISILGIFTASALPAYRTYERRVHTSEATVTFRQILFGQMRHFLEHKKFYPPDGQAISIFHNDPSSRPRVQQLNRALRTSISEDRLLDYHIQAFPGTADDFCFVMVSAPFPLFADGTSQLIGILDKHGKLMATSEFPAVEDKKREMEKKTSRKDKDKG